MTDTEFLSQLIESMEEAVNKLEQANNQGKSKEIMKIKFFIMELYRRISIELNT